MNQRLRAVLGRITAGAVSLTVVTYFVAIALALTLVTSTPLSAELQVVRVHFFTGAFLVYPIITPIPIDLLLLSDGCIIIYIVCFIVAFRAKPGFIASLSSLREAGRLTRESNWLVAMPLVSSALLIAVIIATPLLDQIGLPSGVPCNPLPACIVSPRAFALLAYSPLSEEIAFRITPLGLIVALRALMAMVSRPNRYPRIQLLQVIGLSFLSPETAKTRAGLESVEKFGLKRVHWIEWIFILATSAAFGLAHVLSPGTSWDPGKAVTAGISGFALAVVFLTYGAYAAVLLHWFFDFYLEIFEVGASVLGDPIAIIGGFIALLIFLVGVLSIAVALVWLVKRILRRSLPTTYKTPEPGPFPVQA
jgi:Type II CAAX prenyl endopeptidase Rce1-like